MARKRLGELLLERGAVTAEQLQGALQLQRQSGNRLGAALVAMGVLTEDALVDALAEALNLQVVSLADLQVDPDALRALRDRFCNANDLFPVSLRAEGSSMQLTVAMADPLNLPAIEEIEFTTGFKVLPRLASLSQVRGAIRAHYKLAVPPPLPVRRPVTEEVVLTDAVLDEPAVPTRSVALPKRAATAPPRAVTGRTELAELIREREEAIKRARPVSGGAKATPVLEDLAYLLGEPMLPADPHERLDLLEHRLWTLMRLMAKKGLLTREEFLAELEP